jgi:uridine kinase
MTIINVASKMLSTIQQLKEKYSRPIVVALDGGSGSGKSTLAAQLANELDTALIPVDDFFSANIPDYKWDIFSVEEKLNNVFDWQRLRQDVIKPLRAGKPAQWYAFDFVSGVQPDGTHKMLPDPVERRPADIILLDGAYTTGPALRDLVDLAILIDVPIQERHARLALREEASFLQQWHERWDPLETYYFNEECPKETFDLIVKNTD